MSNNKLFFGSICVTDLIEQLKLKHSAFSKAQNGKIYANVNVWLNEEKDKFGNIMSIQINPSKEMKDIEKKLYIGNMKESEGGKPVSDRDTAAISTDYDIPTRDKGPRPGETGVADDLPF